MTQTDTLSPAAADVLAAARSLPAAQRVALTDRLLDDLDAAEERPPFDATEAEMAELYRLADDVRAGREPTFPIEELLAILDDDLDDHEEENTSRDGIGSQAAGQ